MSCRARWPRSEVAHPQGARLGARKLRFTRSGAPRPPPPAPRRSGVGGRGPLGLAPDDPADAQLSHQVASRSRADVMALAPELLPALAVAIHLVVVLPGPPQGRLERGVGDSTADGGRALAA